MAATGHDLMAADTVAYSSDLGVPPSGTTVTARVGESVSALAQVEVGADGAVLVHNASAGPVEVSVDVSGWYSTSEPSNPDGGGFVPRDPTSVLGWTSVTGGAETTVDESGV